LLECQISTFAFPSTISLTHFAYMAASVLRIDPVPPQTDISWIQASVNC
jgi:hypothetical protein